MLSALLHRWLPLALVTLAALWLRTHDLADRPMHADEANQAVKLGQLLETGDYAFDPRDHHGPTLYYLALPIAWLRGETTLASLTETTVRLLPAMAGTLSVFLLYLLASPPPLWHGRPACGRRSAPAPSVGIARRAARRLLVNAGSESHSSETVTSGAEPDPPASSPRAGWLPLCAAAFLAVWPPALYYSRYFVQETLLVAFTLATFVCVQRWSRCRHPGWALAAGACVGLMQSTKATTPLFLAAGALGWLAVHAFSRSASESRPWGDGGHPDHHRADPAVGPTSTTADQASDTSATSSPQPRRLILRDFALALAAALLVATAFYSSFGAHWAGLRDALATYTDAAARAASGAGHEKSWWYYLRLLGWHREGGLVWNQLPFTALALCGAALAFLLPFRPPGTCQLIVDMFARATADESRVIRWAAVYTVLVALALSAIPYKTPWHIIHLGPGLALLAAGALAVFASVDRFVPPTSAASAATSPEAAENVRRFRSLLGNLAAGLVFAAVLYSLQAQTRLAVFLRPADARNPYAYVHSSPDVLKLRPLAEAALARHPDAVIRVISEEYWPIPWYFRGLSHVGYWTTPPADCDAALVIASATHAGTVRNRLQGRYRESYLGLRPGFLLVVFTPDP